MKKHLSGLNVLVLMITLAMLGFACTEGKKSDINDIQKEEQLPIKDTSNK